jgi:hypothetical protein
VIERFHSARYPINPRLDVSVGQEYPVTQLTIFRVIKEPEFFIRLFKIFPFLTIGSDGKNATGGNIINPGIGKQVGKISKAGIVGKNGDALKFIIGS